MLRFDSKRDVFCDLFLVLVALLLKDVIGLSVFLLDELLHLSCIPSSNTMEDKYAIHRNDRGSVGTVGGTVSVESEFVSFGMLIFCNLFQVVTSFRKRRMTFCFNLRDRIPIRN